MWGLERLWPEGLLWGAGIPLALWLKGRPYLVASVLLFYGLALWLQVGTGSFLWETPWWGARLASLLMGLSALTYVWHPPAREGGIAILLQAGAYSLLLRSTHLAMSWAMLEVGAIAGYFVVVSLGSEKNRWAAAIRYFIWNVLASAMIFLSLAMRLSAGRGLSYPLISAGWVPDNLLGWGWAIKVGFIPWQSWLLGVYRALPPIWAGWFSAVPKGALLANLLFMLPDTGEGSMSRAVFYTLSAITLLGAYAVAWTQKTPLEILFWGSLGQGAFIGLVLMPGGQAAGWTFWMVYAVGTWLAFAYADRPWQTPLGRVMGFLILANLAALPPVLGFWVKVALLERGFALLTDYWRYLLISSAAVALIGGLLSYGKAFWLLWQAPTEGLPLSRSQRGLYLIGGAGLLLLGIGVGIL